MDSEVTSIFAYTIEGIGAHPGWKGTMAPVGDS